MPLAAATAALVIVVDLARPQRQAPTPVSSVARQESAPTVPPPTAGGGASPGAAAAPAVAAPAPTASRRADSRYADSRRDEVASADKNRPQSPVSAKPLADQPAAAQAAATTEPRAKAEGATTGAPTPVGAPAPRLAAPAPPQTVAAGPAPADARERAAPPAAADAAPAVRPEAFRSENASGRGGAAPSGIRAMKAATAAPTVIVSPDRDSQWRMVNGAIEHTADGGRSWQAQTLTTSEPIRAGAAPAARVCWLVGARGVVMLTTDGVSWRRIEFPDPVDLVAIQASDESHASVTAATGRSYVTSDGGKGWTIR